MITVKKATFDEAVYIATHLRAIDIKELKAAYGNEPWDAVIKSFDISDWCRVGFIDELPCVLFGIAPSEEEGYGVPWMVATEEIKTINKSIVISNSIKAVRKMEEKYRVLFNYVHPENDVSIRWLKWLGFTVTNLSNEKGLLYFYKGDSQCV